MQQEDPVLLFFKKNLFSRKTQSFRYFRLEPGTAHAERMLKSLVIQGIFALLVITVALDRLLYKAILFEASKRGMQIFTLMIG